MALTDLLHAILQHPNADAPRLAYAAALRAEGREEEASRIEKRVHAAAHYLALGEGSPERESLRYDAPEPYPVRAKPGVSTWGKENGLGGAWEPVMRRGFAESAIVESATGEDMLRVGAHHPLVALSIRGPSFDQPARAPEALLGCAWMQRLVHLALHGFSAKDDVASVLGRATHLTSLETLYIGSCKVDNARAKKLSEATLPALRHLHSFDNTFRATGLKPLLARFAGSLETLTIDGHAGIDDAWGSLLATTPFPKLETLTLGGPGKDFAFSDALVKALLESPALAHVQSITFRGGQLSAASRQHIDARFPPFVLEEFTHDASEGLRVTALLRSTWNIPRRLTPPSLLHSGARDVRHIAGAIAFTLDGQPRNSFDPFTVQPGATHRIALHASPEVAARIPKGQLSLASGARLHHFEYGAQRPL